MEQETAGERRPAAPRRLCSSVFPLYFSTVLLLTCSIEKGCPKAALFNRGDWTRLELFVAGVDDMDMSVRTTLLATGA